MNITSRAANQLQALDPGDVASIMTIANETTCRTCGRPFAPSPEAIRAGTWHTCPACRGDAGAEHAHMVAHRCRNAPIGARSGTFCDIRQAQNVHVP